MYLLFIQKRINEDLNSVFVRYERFKKSRPKIDDDVAPLAADPCPTGLLVSQTTQTRKFQWLPLKTTETVPATSGFATGYESDRYV